MEKEILDPQDQTFLQDEYFQKEKVLSYQMSAGIEVSGDCDEKTKKSLESMDGKFLDHAIRQSRRRRQAATTVGSTDAPTTITPALPSGVSRVIVTAYVITTINRTFTTDPPTIARINIEVCRAIPAVAESVGRAKPRNCTLKSVSPGSIIVVTEVVLEVVNKDGGRITHTTIEIAIPPADVIVYLSTMSEFTATGVEIGDDATECTTEQTTVCSDKEGGCFPVGTSGYYCACPAGHEDTDTDPDVFNCVPIDGWNNVCDAPFLATCTAQELVCRTRNLGYVCDCTQDQYRNGDNCIPLPTTAPPPTTTPVPTTTTVQATQQPGPAINFAGLQVVVELGGKFAPNITATTIRLCKTLKMVGLTKSMVLEQCTFGGISITSSSLIVTLSVSGSIPDSGQAITTELLLLFFPVAQVAASFTDFPVLGVDLATSGVPCSAGGNTTCYLYGGVCARVGGGEVCTCPEGQTNIGQSAQVMTCTGTGVVPTNQKSLGMILGLSLGTIGIVFLITICTALVLTRRAVGPLGARNYMGVPLPPPRFGYSVRQGPLGRGMHGPRFGPWRPPGFGYRPGQPGQHPPVYGGPTGPGGRSIFGGQLGVAWATQKQRFPLQTSFVRRPTRMNYSYRGPLGRLRF